MIKCGSFGKSMALLLNSGIMARRYCQEVCFLQNIFLSFEIHQAIEIAISSIITMPMVITQCAHFEASGALGTSSFVSK